jgi:hypothetical protein
MASPVFSSSPSAAFNSAVASPKVKFYPSVAVVLIPTVQEYRNAHLEHDLWYGESDFETFKMSAKKELMDCISTNPSLNVKDAKKTLYQDTDMLC